METPQGPFQMLFEFVVDGGNLTGSMSNDFMGAMPISEGAIQGNELSFKLTFQGGPDGPMTISYKGTVKGDELALTSKFEGTPPGGGLAEVALTATRVK
ncbi:MAG TPA: hypothetical protein VJA26_08940 [Gammaproteobacteria bacterium]|nr:hypothetical protein [Gammaproteobacteria bacterium]